MLPRLTPSEGAFLWSVRFRAVYEGEPIDGDVTAEAYQPTTQAAELVGKSVLIDGPPTEEGELGQLALTPSSKLEFKIGPELVKTADGSYFVSRVHDMAKPYVPPDFGSFRHSFPIANRGQAPLRKFHLRTYMERQREAGFRSAQASLISRCSCTSARCCRARC